MALDIIYTSAGYNAYTDISGMDTAMAEVGALHKTIFWSSLTEPVKEALIKASTKAINKLTWLGERNAGIVVPTMQWPRTGIEGVLSTTVPSDLILRMACWITYNAEASPLSKKGNVSSKTVGEVSLTYGASGSIDGVESCSSYANEYLDSNYLDTFGGIGTIGLHRHP